MGKQDWNDPEKLWSPPSCSGYGRSKGKLVLTGGDVYCLKKMPVQEIKNPGSLVYTYHSKVSLNIKPESKLQIEPASSCPASLEQENNRPLSVVNNLLPIRRWFGQNRPILLILSRLCLLNFYLPTSLFPWIPSTLFPPSAKRSSSSCGLLCARW